MFFLWSTIEESIFFHVIGNRVLLHEKRSTKEAHLAGKKVL